MVQPKILALGSTGHSSVLSLTQPCDRVHVSEARGTDSGHWVQSRMPLAWNGVACIISSVIASCPDLEDGHAVRGGRFLVF